MGLRARKGSSPFPGAILNDLYDSRKRGFSLFVRALLNSGRAESGVFFERKRLTEMCLEKKEEIGSL